MNLGSRMKLYEGQESDRRLTPLLPVMARLDGRAFHNFTKGMHRPYDVKFRALMVHTAKALMVEANPTMAYVQSDEISLVWYQDTIESEIYFAGRIQKMVSTLAATASVAFTDSMAHFLPDKEGSFAAFDCRVWTCPTLMEAANCFLWRERDATKNSILSAGQAHFSHKQLHGKNTTVIQDMLHEKGVNWNDYPADFKRGTWVQKRRVVRPFTTDELEKLPAKHEAQTNPDLEVERWEIHEIDMPPFGTVKNRVGVIFFGESPEGYEEDKT